jgi:N-acyl-D-aspartate/D-glutamate deacylase
MSQSATVASRVVGRVTGRGRREIDAKGKYVSPGFIDMMDQSGSVLLRSGLAENKLRQGCDNVDRW